MGCFALIPGVRVCVLVRLNDAGRDVIIDANCTKRLYKAISSRQEKKIGE